MKIAETIDAARSSVAEAKAAGKSVALVPTMGALHAGHLSLIEAAKESCDFVVVSIFVNPTQFGPDEDLDAYPGPIDADLEACRKLAVDLVFAPSVDAMYGQELLADVPVGKIGETLCGRSRPGHFAGVCTVVAKLVNIVQPDKAFFGAKDFQQTVIIRRMVEDMNLPVEIVVCPTIREADGLAMSSRNAYLTADDRAQAAALHAGLQMAAGQIREGHPPAGQVIEAMRKYLAAEAPNGHIDYVQIVDPNELCDVENTDQPVLIALAVRIGATRLIDNVLVDAPPDP